MAQEAGGGPPAAGAAATDVAFVGRWFVAHPADIDTEVLAAGAPPPPPPPPVAGSTELMSIEAALAAGK